MADESNSRIIPIDIEEEMKSSYIDYSMSVIVSRALPDVRDGLKPVQRRVLYGMSDLGLSPGSPPKKSARIVGEVLGKYHPHGDSAVYEAMVRMAQDFSLRYPHVNGQGNFGSIDGDSAAAMRYTEVRLQRIAEEMLRDLKKETVDFRANFDDSLEEPEVLPSAVPNLLMNGASGIAVGMATNIPPHNLGELVDGLVALIDNPDMDPVSLIDYIKAPDFPTGGIINGRAGVRQAYATGQGRVVMRAKIHEEEIGKRLALVVTEIPYQVNKSKLIEKIAYLVRDKKIEGIHDLRDESDRDGMRIVIELKKDGVPLVIQNQLYKYSQLQQTFGVNMVALVKGRPRLLNLKECLDLYIEHRHEVVVRRTEFELRKAEERAHILEGLKIALDHLDAVIAIIRNSANRQEAEENLMAGVFPEKLTKKVKEALGLPTGSGSMFTLSEIQAKAILELRLHQLTGLEQQKVEDEYAEVSAEIVRLRGILDDKESRMGIIKAELLEMKEKYADPRRTEIDDTGGDDIVIEDLITVEPNVVTITHQGLVKRTQVHEYRQQGRGGKGMKGTGTRDEDYVEHLFTSSTHDYLLFFTDKGKCFWQRVYQIPEGSRTSKGRSVRNLIKIDQEDRVRAVLSVSKDDFRDEDFGKSHYIMMATRSGQVKKTTFSKFDSPRVDGIIAISINEGDQLIEAWLTDGDAKIILANSGGRAIQFHESDCRPMGRNTQGVRGMRLGEGEELVGMVISQADDDKQILSISANGYGKRTPLSEYPVQTRGGKGVLTQKTSEKTGKMVAVRGVLEDDDLMIITQNGIMIRMPMIGISVLGRNTMGVRLIKIKDGDAIADVSRLVAEDQVVMPDDIEDAVIVSETPRGEDDGDAASEEAGGGEEE